MFKIGADPELFMFKGQEAVSAYGMIKGTKHEPFKVKNGAVQVDGMALEFNIDPAESEDQFITNITSVMEQLKLMVPEYDVLAVPVANFSAEYLKTQPREALELGCDPDYNAYTGKANPRPNGKNTFRTGAGHIHIGWCEGVDPLLPEHFETCKLVTKQLDHYLGLGSLIWDTDSKRRLMYGKAGCFRPKSYGVEYRTLSNAWLKDEGLMRWVYKTAQKALDDLANGKNMEEVNPGSARVIIDNTGKEMGYNLSQGQQYARSFLKGYGVALPGV